MPGRGQGDTVGRTQNKKRSLIKRERISRVLVFISLDILMLMAAAILACFAPRLAVPAGERDAFVFPLSYLAESNGRLVVEATFTIVQLVLFAAIYIGVFFALRLYSNMWKLSGMDEGIHIVAAVGTSTIACYLLNRFVLYEFINPKVFPANNGFNILLMGVIMMFLVGVSRFSLRWLRNGLHTGRFRMSRNGQKAILIVGAGFFGTYVKRQIESGEEGKTSYVAAFVDDDLSKVGLRVGGVKIVGTIDDIPKAVERYKIQEIIVAIPSVSEKRRSEILNLCIQTKCHIRSVARLQELTDTPTMRDVRETKISDILFRTEVELDKELVEKYLTHKTVLVTGGGGSIGSEIARQVARFYPRKIILFDVYENTTYELFVELKRMYPWLDVEIAIGSIRDKVRLDEVMESKKPDIVLHCAAHKHVPLMESSPAEAIKNNVGGTLNVLRSADEHGVERFVQLSTDKAVNPTNVMGASKRICELLVQDFARGSEMKCMTVRFGNVLGSHGSVIPLFERQIAAGGPVMVTDPNITRYFMTIPEAAQLVLQAGAYGETGAIYVLDMGQPVKIMDLAEKVIRFHGYEPNKDMPIEIIGLRPGEKLTEELLMDEEADKMQKTEHGRIFKAHPSEIDRDTFRLELGALLRMAETGDPHLEEQIQKIVPNFRHLHNTDGTRMM